MLMAVEGECSLSRKKSKVSGGMHVLVDFIMSLLLDPSHCSLIEFFNPTPVIV